MEKRREKLTPPAASPILLMGVQEQADFFRSRNLGSVQLSFTQQSSSDLRETRNGLTTGRSPLLNYHGVAPSLPFLYCGPKNNTEKRTNKTKKPAPSNFRAHKSERPHALTVGQKNENRPVHALDRPKQRRKHATRILNDRSIRRLAHRLRLREVSVD